MMRWVLSLLLLTGPVVWSTHEKLGKGVNKTFVAKGTRRGESYVFHARGVCQWERMRVWTRRGPISRDRPEHIDGIEFRVTFGSGEHQFLEVGEKEAEQTELSFVADRDNVPIHIEDHWDLPDKVHCTIDGIEVVQP